MNQPLQLVLVAKVISNHAVLSVAGHVEAGLNVIVVNASIAADGDYPKAAAFVTSWTEHPLPWSDADDVVPGIIDVID